MKKTIWIAVLIYVLFVALVVGIGYALHLNGPRFVIFCVVLGVVGALATVAIVIYKRKAIDAQVGPEANAVEAASLDALVRSADARLKASPGGKKSLASSPLVYVLGDENSAKTQTVLQSGLDAELLAGEVYRDNLVAQTQLANIWFSPSAAVVEAGGALLKQPRLWQQLVRLTQPNKLGTALKKGAQQSTRAAILCVSIERITANNSAESVRTLGQMLNERLRILSQTLGISLPIYVLFTKLDTIPAFADYAVNLTDEEVRQPVGALLPRADAGAGLYAERAAAQSSARFDELCYSLSEFRIEVLSRGGEADKLAKAYEFPRELRKMRAAIVDLLVEVGRPSQLGVNPFLRGFYFSGMRARLVEDNIAPAAQVQPAAPTPDAGATRIFSFNAAQLPQAPVAARGSSRRVPQWVFLPHLFPHVILNDRSALETSRTSSKVNFVKRLLIASVATCFFLYAVALTVSYMHNSDLENRLRAAAAMPTESVSRGDAASMSDLENLEQLRLIFTQIAGYQKDGAPWSYRWGLYNGDHLYTKACAAYGSHFRTLLLSPTQAIILAHMSALPATRQPTDDYSDTYRPLRAYLITTSNPDKSTTDFLPDALQTAWVGNHTYPSNATDLSLAQFQTYAATLAEPNSCMAKLGGSPRTTEVNQARAYLSQFQGIEQVYISMKTAANRKFPQIRFNDKFPGSKAYVVDNYAVDGAFSKDGYTFMRNAILHPDPYAKGEEWVLGPQNGNPMDMASLTAQLPARYLSDFLNAWRSYLKAAVVVNGADWPAAKEKLHQLDSPSSALLQLFQVISTNTAVNDPAFSQPFQAPQSVVAPNSPTLPTASPYVQGLAGLDTAVGTMLNIPGFQNDPQSVQPVIAAASAGEGAVSAIRGGFTPPDPTGGMDTTSEKLLLAPIKAVEALAKTAPAAAASGGGKTLCALLEPVLSKFPFNPDATVDATADEVTQAFQPGKGTFAQQIPNLKMVIQQGNTFIAAPNSLVTVNPAFLRFLSAAQTVSSTLFPTGGTQLQMSFTLTEEGGNAAPATVDIDGTTLSAPGQTKQIAWTSSQGSSVRLTAAGSSTPFSGPWSVFHFAYAANHPSPNKLEFSTALVGQKQLGSNASDYKFDVGGSGAQLLNPGFMRTQLRCVAKVAE